MVEFTHEKILWYFVHRVSTAVQASLELGTSSLNLLNAKLCRRLHQSPVELWKFNIMKKNETHGDLGDFSQYSITKLQRYNS